MQIHLCDTVSLITNHSNYFLITKSNEFSNQDVTFTINRINARKVN